MSVGTPSIFSNAPITGGESQTLASVVQKFAWYQPEPYLTTFAIASILVGKTFSALT